MVSQTCFFFFGYKQSGLTLMYSTISSTVVNLTKGRRFCFIKLPDPISIRERFIGVEPPATGSTRGFLHHFITTSLIENSVHDVKEGSELANQTAAQLSEVANQVQQVGDTILKIDQASQRQAAAISQITQGVEQVSAVVQTNSATAEESAAASEELSAQAETLSKLIKKFKLAD
jgi:hypothetical protein